MGTETAGEPPAPPEETRLEATSPEEVAEAAAKEEARLAAEKAAEEEARRLEEERVRAEREEQIRQESEELEETVYRLAPLARTNAENAEGMGYDRGQRFGEKLDEMKEKLAQGEAAMGGRNFGKAKAWFEESMAAAGWCEENAPLRAAAGRAKGAAEEAKKKAEAMDGAHLGLTAWRKGEKTREKAETAWKKAEFREATAGWNEAGTAYAESEKAGRVAKVEQGLEAAQGAKKRGAWEAVIAAVDGVLTLDGGNTDAKRLKAEAEGQLKPSIRLTATLDGKDVVATVTEGLELSGQTTPVTVENVESGGSYGFAAEYRADGKTYAGRTTVQAKERGMTDASIALQERKPEAGEERDFDLGNGEKIRMVWCPAGSFTMGSPRTEEGRGDDETLHRVTLTKGFWLAKCELTQKQWTSVMGSHRSWFKGDDLPVECLSWNDCQEFCRKTGLRLPTEAEWEYACRAGMQPAYSWGNALKGDKANCDGNYPCGTTTKGRNLQKTSPVGSYAPNAWGLFDMHGNVWEWCEDELAEYPPGPVTDYVKRNGSTVSGVHRVVRGGSWLSSAQDCRSANRHWFPAGAGLPDVGFRPVCSAELSD